MILSLVLYILWGLCLVFTIFTPKILATPHHLKKFATFTIMTQQNPFKVNKKHPKWPPLPEICIIPCLYPFSRYKQCMVYEWLLLASWNYFMIVYCLLEIIVWSDCSVLCQCVSSNIHLGLCSTCFLILVASILKRCRRRSNVAKIWWLSLLPLISNDLRGSKTSVYWSCKKWHNL